MDRRVIGKCVYFITERRALREERTKGGGPNGWERTGRIFHMRHGGEERLGRELEASGQLT